MNTGVLKECIMREYLWNLKKQPPEKQIVDLSQQLNVDPSIAGILIQRGIDDFEKARQFFRPSINDLHDPFLLKGMEEAIQRITFALDHKENIMIYGDYDVDGTTAVAALYLHLTGVSDHIHYYIPDRYSEGYGISKDGIDTAQELDCRVLIALDCGIRGNTVIDYANTKGIDVIVCDHHIPEKELPRAHAILNPKQPGCPYPYKELSGCGIGFKLLQALDQKLKNPAEDHMKYLDLVMVSIAADLVPITGENRILAYYGLEKIKRDPITGLRALLQVAGLDHKSNLSISNIVFGIAPRINAAGRMKHGFGAVQVLISKDANEAHERSQLIHDQNTLRRQIDEEITRHAIELIEKTHPPESYCSVVFNEGWHQGVLGIVASRCIEKIYRPTIIMAKKDDHAIGSARSIKGFNLYKVLEKCSDLFIQWGGHAYAAGLSIKLEKLDEFRDRLNNLIKQELQGKLPIPSIEVDSEIKLSGVDRKFFSVLNQMEPFGPGNMRPVFLSKKVKSVFSPRILKDLHLKARIIQEKGGTAFDCIGFKKYELREKLEKDQQADMLFCVFENNYMGDSKLELEIKDIKSSGNGT